MSDVENDEYLCLRCGRAYSLRYGCDPTAFCDGCAQELLSMFDKKSLTSLDAENERMRTASGNVTSSDPLMLFLYLLVRDHLPIGRVEAVIAEVLQAEDPKVLFTNGWVAQWAEDVKNRLHRSESRT